MMSRLILLGVAALLAVLHGPAAASAESYPQRAVRFILPFGPGAEVDITARMLAERLAARWGKPVVVENCPGGDGIVAINPFTSAQDDHTLLFVPTSTFTAHPYTHDKLPYDPQRDLLPIATVTVIVIALASPESLKVASLGDFVAMARARPGTLNAAAAPGNSDFVLAGFLKDMNLQVAKVPYRDIMQAPNDLAEGRIQLLMSSYASMRGLIEAGRLKVLAVTSRKRVGIAPEIPTVAEAGFPFLGLDGLIGVFPPRNAGCGARGHRRRYFVRGCGRPHDLRAAGGNRSGCRCARTRRIRGEHQRAARQARRHRPGAWNQGRAVNVAPKIGALTARTFPEACHGPRQSSRLMSLRRRL